MRKYITLFILMICVLTGCGANNAATEEITLAQEEEILVSKKDILTSDAYESWMQTHYINDKLYYSVVDRSKKDITRIVYAMDAEKESEKAVTSKDMIAWSFAVDEAENIYYIEAVESKKKEENVHTEYSLYTVKTGEKPESIANISEERNEYIEKEYIQDAAVWNGKYYVMTYRGGTICGRIQYIAERDHGCL